MRQSNPWRSWVTVLAAAALVVSAPGVAAAEPPSNDDFDGATVVSALPFQVTANTAEATTVDDDPDACSSYRHNSVWFRYTATEDALVEATASSSWYDPIVSAYTGTRGDLSLVPGVCKGGNEGPVSFRVTAGTTYHLLVASYYAGGELSMRLRTVPPSPNDDIADAEPVPGLPTTATGNLARAGSSPGEQVPSCDEAATQSVWYSYSPSTSRWVAASAWGQFQSTITAYGPDMAELDCQGEGSAVFRAEVGRTYYIRLAAAAGEGGPFSIDFRTAPALSPWVSTSPDPASVFDELYLNPFTGDPLNRPIASGELDFGDGTSVAVTAEYQSVRHRYTTDGEYPLTLTLTTDDGRTGTTTSILRVETHDVAITEFAVPAKARPDQTKPITVTIANTRYGETVEVELLKQTGDYFTSVGELSQWVPASSTGTVRFPFAYTFGDAGPVTFKAVARLGYPSEDDNPADNEELATTTVRR